METKTNQIRLDDEVVLTAKSKKGKDKIASEGSEWIVIGKSTAVAFSTKSGNWLLLKSKKTGYKKWVCQNGDSDFNVQINFK